MNELKLSEAVLQRRVFNQSILDQHIAHFMLGQTAQYIDPEKNVIDVGAAVGMYSSFWADKCKILYAFEAVAPVYDQLKKLEDRFDNVETFNVAVSDEVGFTDFYVDDQRLSNSSFRDLVGGQKIRVETTTLDFEFIDNEMCDISGEIGFIKIDVEGHELDVLHGAEQLIERCNPTVMCEIYPKFNNGPVSETFKFFFDRGYKCFFNIKGKGLEEVLGIEQGVNIASDENLIPLHDGDFLFTKE